MLRFDRGTDLPPHVMVGWYLKRVDPILARVWRVSTEKSTHEFIDWEVKKDAWICEFREKVGDT